MEGQNEAASADPEPGGQNDPDPARIWIRIIVMPLIINKLLS